MYSFNNEKGLSVFYNGTPVLTDLGLWMNIVQSPYDRENGSKKMPLTLRSCNDNTACFDDGNGVAALTLTLHREGKHFALHLAGKFDPYGKKGYGTHIDSFKGIGLNFNFPHEGSYIDSYMGCLYWQRNAVMAESDPVRERTQMLLARRKEDHLYLMTLCDTDYKTEIFPEDGSPCVIARSNTVKDDINDHILIGSLGEDVYALPEQTAAFGIAVMKKPGDVRKNKKYPAMFDYLGWCSWDAFHMDVTEQNLLDKAKEFKDKNIPVRWMIFDDMWGDVTDNDRSVMHGRELNDWEAAPDRFPHGLKGVIERIKADYGLKVGIWHPTSGYWAGLNPLGKIAKEHRELLAFTVPGSWPDASRLVHSFEKEKCAVYYDRQHTFYRDCGADFIKIDNQGSTERFTYRMDTIGRCTANLHAAVDGVADKFYEGNLINCMGMPIENFWNRTSTVNRFSGDFQPENRKWFIQHLLQCSYNSLTQGAVYVGDWDMWWSDDDQAKKNAVLRSMSGGPIYMSDELDRSIREVIMPTVLADGRILRLNDPALPCRDCLFTDNEHSGKIYKVFNGQNGYGVVAAFNMDEDEKPVSGSVCAADIENLPEGDYAVYDWFNGTVTVLKSGEKIDLTLNNYDDFRLLIFAPLVNGKAIFGLKEKYMTFMTFEEADGALLAREDGTLLTFADGALKETAVAKGQKIQ